jgi:hypothetical protein
MMISMAALQSQVALLGNAMKHIQQQQQVQHVQQYRLPGTPGTPGMAGMAGTPGTPGGSGSSGGSWELELRKAEGRTSQTLAAMKEGQAAALEAVAEEMRWVADEGTRTRVEEETRILQVMQQLSVRVDRLEARESEREERFHKALDDLTRATSLLGTNGEGGGNGATGGATGGGHRGELEGLRARVVAVETSIASSSSSSSSSSAVTLGGGAALKNSAGSDVWHRIANIEGRFEDMMRESLDIWGGVAWCGPGWCTVVRSGAGRHVRG